MGTFQFQSSGYYLGTSGTVTLGGSGTEPSLLEVVELEVDNSFETGDTLIYRVNGINSSNCTYLGNVDVTKAGGGTVNLPVFALTNGYSFIPIPLTDNLADYTFPSPLNLDTLDTSDYPDCFVSGTMIDTEDGPVQVESLWIGDRLWTASGGVARVHWIGRQRLVVPRRGRRLVCIRAGALGSGLPLSDLTVTVDHGLVIDGLVINASALVNGTTIDFVPAPELPESLTVYHVETEAHEVIQANGAPSETYINYRDRRRFDNFDAYLRLYRVERIIPEMPRPRISSARHLPAHIASRLGIQRRAGFAEDLPNTAA
ncbi:Hint domain-containing protein [uncultured Mameliella sp.]|uniref:Hint domain-containing protein n=1 Tax=uncultured Mameliella sp. TaxID=1447087 RepID=UPI002636F613|nr:Hint domain-containing protein [uncultured Mameliella sp.]